MKSTIALLIFVGVLVFALFSLQADQMMSKSEHSSTMTADSTSQPDMMTMMHNMSNHCKMMKGNIEMLNEQFEKLMEMNDLNALKAEMKKLHEMMHSIHEQMDKQQGMCQNMMSMMHSGDSNGKMEMKGGDSTKTADHSHQH